MRRRFALLALFSATALLCLLAIDRIVYEFFPLGRIIYQPDPIQLYSYIPGASKYFIHTERNGGNWVYLQINDEGYRGASLDSHGEAIRILVYGDSYVAAEFSPLEETYAYRLAEELESLSKEPIETINAGLVGAGPDQIARRMPKEIKQLNPDIIVAVITSGNDFGDLIRNKLYGLNPDGVWTALEPELGPGLRKMIEPDLLSKSGWGRLLRAAWRGAPLRMEQVGLTSKTVASAGDQDATRLIRRHQLEYGNSQIDRDPVVRNLFDDLYDADLSLLPHSPSAQRKRLLMQGVLGEIEQIATEAHVPLLIVVVPSPIDVLDDHFGLHTRWEKFPDYDRRTLSRAVANPAQALGLPVLNLFSAMREAPNPSQLFFTAGNDHWNAQGQALAARLTAQRIGQLGWLEERPGQGH